MTQHPERLGKIKTAVVTGEHPFDVPALHTLFRDIPLVDFYPQHLDDFVADWGKMRQEYDVVVFYCFHQATPGQEQGWWQQGRREALERLGEASQGVLVLHHALLAFPDWPLWSAVCGIADRSFSYHGGQTLGIEVVNAQHPITKGLTAWTMMDETYMMQDAGAASEVLLTTAHPLSMHTLAWTHHYRNARVLCLQSGHDSLAFANPSFRAVVAQGIHWLAGRI